MNIDLKSLQNLKLTKEQQQFLVGGILGFAAAVYGYWAFLLVPINKSITTLSAEVKTKQDSLDKAKRLKAQWEEYAQRLARVQAGVQFANRRLPGELPFTTSFAHLVTLTIEGGVRLSEVKQEEAATLKTEFAGYKKNVADITLISSYHKIGAFLSRLSSEDVIYYFEDLVLDVPPDNMVHDTVKATMKMVSYTDIGKTVAP